MSSSEGPPTEAVACFPYWPKPVVGESLSSWVDRGAEEFDLGRRTAWYYLGLVPRPTSVVSGYGIGLTAEQRAGVVAATGATGEMVDELLLTRFPALFTMLPVPVTQPEVTRWLRWWSGVGWSSRACSSCLGENGGVWLLDWRLPWSFACRRHAEFLATTCPECGSRLQHQPSNRRQRWVCSGEGRRSGASACGFPVAEIEAPPAGPAALDVQRRIKDLVDGAEDRRARPIESLELGPLDEVTHLLRAVMNLGGPALAASFDDVTKESHHAVSAQWSRAGKRNPRVRPAQRVAAMPSEFLPPLLDTAVRLATSTDPVEEWSRLLDSSADAHVSQRSWWRRPSWTAAFPDRHREAFNRAWAQSSAGMTDSSVRGRDGSA
jgi:hypothetical protein